MSEKLYFQNKTVIFNQADYEEPMYLIHSGAVSIYYDYGEPGERFLTTLEAGRYFGEMGLIEARPRSASAVALPNTELEKFTADDLEDFFRNDPSQAIDLFQAVSTRIKELSEDYTGICLLAAQYIDASEDEKKSGILDRLKNLFRKQTTQDVAAEVRAAAADPAALRSLEVDAGAVICREGETEDWMYDVLSGSAAVYAAYGTEEQKLLKVLKDSDTFGEIAMIQHSPRTATVVALEKCRVRVITEAQFLSYFSGSPAKAYHILENSVRRVRELSNQFGDAYRTLVAYIDAEQAGTPSPALSARVKALATAGK